MSVAETTARDWRRTETRQRQKLVGVRLSPDENTAVVLAAAREGKSVAAVLRDAFLERDDPERLATLRSALADAIVYRNDVAAQGARWSLLRGKRDLDLAASYAALLDEMGGVK